MLRVVDPADSKSTIPLDGRLGTRAYGAGAVLVAGATCDWSAALTATEVLLHAKVACYVLAVDADDDEITSSTGIPLEAGEKFHLRVTPGQFIVAIRDTASGNLHILPVA